MCKVKNKDTRTTSINVDQVPNSSAIRQKDESQNGCYKKTKHAKFSEKLTFLNPRYAHVRVLSGGKKCLFFGKYGCFLVTPVLRFNLLPYYRWIKTLIRNLPAWINTTKLLLNTRIHFQSSEFPCACVINVYFHVGLFQLRWTKKTRIKSCQNNDYSKTDVLDKLSLHLHLLYTF